MMFFIFLLLVSGITISEGKSYSKKKKKNTSKNLLG